MTDHDALRDLLGAYAVDAVDARERAALDAHLETCAECRSELDTARATLAVLVPDALEPTGDDLTADPVWARIDAEVTHRETDATDTADTADTDPTAPDTDRVLDLGAARSTRRATATRLVALVAAAAAAILVVVAAIAVVSEDEPSDLPEVASAAFEAPDTNVVDLVDDQGRPVARAALGDDGQGYLDLGDLPELDAGRTYQLWRLDDAAPVSLGLLGDGSDEVAGFRLGRDAAGLAISVEPATGVVAPSGPVVASAEL